MLLCDAATPSGRRLDQNMSRHHHHKKPAHAHAGTHRSPARAASPAPARHTPRTAAAPAESEQNAYLGWLVVGVVAIALLLGLLASSVGMRRAMNTQRELDASARSEASMICTDGKTVSDSPETLWGEITGDPVFRCTEWETREGKQERNVAARQKVAQARESALRQQRGW